MRTVRLGDDIDDFCVKCKRVMNHAVVSILNDQAAKVRCRTCYNDHDFRNEQPPPPKVDARKAALFNQVLGNVAVPAAPEPEVKVVSAAAGEAETIEPEAVVLSKAAVPSKAAAPKAAKAAAGKAVAEKPKARKKSKA